MYKRNGFFFDAAIVYYCTKAWYFKLHRHNCAFVTAHVRLCVVWMWKWDGVSYVTCRSFYCLYRNFLLRGWCGFEKYVSVTEYRVGMILIHALAIDWNGVWHCVVFSWLCKRWSQDWSCYITRRLVVQSFVSVFYKATTSSSCICATMYTVWRRVCSSTAIWTKCFVLNFLSESVLKRFNSASAYHLKYHTTSRTGSVSIHVLVHVLPIVIQN